MLTVLLIGCVLSSGISFAKKPTECKDIDPSQIPDDDDHLEKAAASLERILCNETAIGLGWSVASEDLDDLCGYSLHWRAGSSPTQTAVVIEPSVRRYYVTGLKPGTQYHFHIVTYYSTQHMPRSWLLTTFTTGCGPDVAFCNLKGSERCDSSTGRCICKTNSTTGDKCDTCQPGFYLHDHGCIGCDNCVNDGVMSNGTCRPAPDPQDTMLCNCFYPYTGKHCRHCEKGFYLKGQMECTPCECYHGKETGNTSSTCDELSGKCVCPLSRTGDRCERCAKGYAGNGLEDECFRVSSHAGLTALIVVVVVVVVLFAFVAFYLICHRRCKNHIPRGFWTARLREDYDKVNFTTLEEEPDCDKTKA